MLFALICTDKPNSTELRAQIRAEHLAYLNTLGEALKFAGPFLDDAGNSVGSMVVIAADSRLAAEAIAVADPYAKSSLFSSVDIKPWRWTMKNPEAK